MQHYQECIALGSKTGISLVSNASPTKIEKLYSKLWKEIFIFERRFSRFLPDSELSMFNKHAGIKQFISQEFHDLLTAAFTIAHETNGLYNPFILPAVQKAGYTNSRVLGHEQDSVDDHSHKTVTNIHNLELGKNWARIPYGTAIDLGGCGKGYLADQLSSKLPDIITGYWFSFGGDIAIGGLDDRQLPWSVTVENAMQPSTNIGTLTINHTSGIATSGTTVLNGEKSGKTWHHLIDPRTNQPAKTDILLATVKDSSSLRADVLASCAVILGSKQGVQFLKQKKVNSAIIQFKTSTGQTDIIHLDNNQKIRNDLCVNY